VIGYVGAAAPSRSPWPIILATAGLLCRCISSIRLDLTFLVLTDRSLQRGFIIGIWRTASRKLQRSDAGGDGLTFSSAGSFYR